MAPSSNVDYNSREGYGDYAATVASELDWLVSLAGGENGGTDRFPASFNHDYFAPMLNYAAEDSYLANARYHPVLRQ